MKKKLFIFLCACLTLPLMAQTDIPEMRQSALASEPAGPY